MAIKEIILNNKGAKLIALFLAVISWYAIEGAISFEAIVSDIPITPELDEGWAVQELSPSTVDIVFRGPQDALRNLNKQQVAVRVDLRNEKPEGPFVVKIDPSDVESPTSVRAVSVEPGEVMVNLDQESQVQLPVKITLNGELPVGYEVVRAVSSPAFVDVKGPRLRLRAVESLRTEPLDLSGRTGSFTVRLAVLAPSESWRARIEPEKVMAEVTVVERSATKQVDDVPVGVYQVNGSSRKTTLNPTKVNVVVRGKSDKLQQVSRRQLSVYVDCSGLDATAKYDLPVQVHAPDGLEVISVTPETITVSIDGL